MCAHMCRAPRRTATAPQVCRLLHEHQAAEQRAGRTGGWIQCKGNHALHGDEAADGQVVDHPQGQVQPSAGRHIVLVCPRVKRPAQPCSRIGFRTYLTSRPHGKPVTC